MPCITEGRYSTKYTVYFQLFINSSICKLITEQAQGPKLQHFKPLKKVGCGCIRLKAEIGRFLWLMGQLP